jgi:hypothetical protein
LGFIALGLVAVGVIASMYLRPLPADIGRWFTYDEAKQMPEWRDGGRTAFFRKPAILYFHNSMGGIGLKRAEAGIALAALVVTIAVFPRAIPPTAWMLLVTGLAMWALAHATLFKLYLPSRYLSYVRPIFAMIWAAGFVREIGRHCHGRFEFRRGLSTIFAAFVVMFAIWQFVIFRHAMVRQPWDVPAGFDGALSALRSMPKETLVAAHPDDGNAIPLRARRSVLTNTEVSVAFNKAYYADQKRRLEASFAMLYATDWSTIDALADAWSVDVFLIDRRRLQDPLAKPFIYFEPFRTSNVPLIEVGQSRGFALLDPPSDRILFSEGDVTLVRVGGRR